MKLKDLQEALVDATTVNNEHRCSGNSDVEIHDLQGDCIDVANDAYSLNGVFVIQVHI